MWEVGCERNLILSSDLIWFHPHPTSHISPPHTNRTYLLTQMRKSLIAVPLVLLALATDASAQAAPNTLTAEEKAAGWRLLFDGKTTAGWRAYGADTMPSGWQAVDGILTRVSRAADIITKEQFGDFELTLDWKLE